MNLGELIEWHQHNAAECRKEGQYFERVFHLEAVALLENMSERESA